jgi:hypothetical protein
MSDKISTYGYKEILSPGWLKGRADYWNGVSNIDVSTIPGILVAASERIEELEAELDRLLDGLDANSDDRCGLTQGEWDERVASAKHTLENTQLSDCGGGDE